MLAARRKPAHAVEPWRYPQREEKQKPLRKKAVAVQKCAQMIMVALVFSVAVSVVAHYSVLVGISYQTTRLQRQIAALKSQQYHLQLETARLSSLDRIEAIALNELGLVYPEPGQHIFLTLDR